MALSESIAAYEDCFETFDRARQSAKGVRVLFDNKKAAGYFRIRMNQARVLDRREAMRQYERTDPRYGKSEFDKFRIKLVEADEKDGTWWVYVDPFGQREEIMDIEEL